jgi:hypothetical protein
MSGPHNDLYVYTEKPQLAVGQFYLNNAGGFDITFGKGLILIWKLVIFNIKDYI